MNCCNTDPDDCPTCYGEGQIVTCIDDLCADTDTCIHGDGYAPCPDCGGHGRTPCCQDVDTA
jgi:hypothetical protein